MVERTCKDYSMIGKVCAGTAYAWVQNYFFGDDSIILVGEGEGGRNLVFAAAESWREANNPATRFGLATDESKLELNRHLAECDDGLCKEVMERFSLVGPYLPGGGKELGGKGLILASAFHGKMGNDPLYLSRSNGWSEAIDGLRPFFEWFTEDGLWVWPERDLEIRKRLELKRV